MWAACCNWFCLNGQPEDLPHHHRPPAGSRAYANAGYSSFPSPTGPPEPTCHGCGERFGGSSLQNVCLDCQKSFCPACWACPREEAEDGEAPPCLCRLCRRFRATAFQREELIKMKVKDLRDYLELRQIPTHTCREKDELVRLILGQQKQQQPPGPHGNETPRGPPPPRTPATDPQDQYSSVPASLAYPPGRQVAVDPAAPVEEQPQANGHAPPHQDMAEVENEGSALNEEEIQDHGHALPNHDMAETENREAANEEDSQSTDSEDNLVVGRRASLSDLTSARDISALSVRQLKEILARNFVNYKGCCEKWELMERVTRLYKEKDLQRLVSDTDDQTAPSGNAPQAGLEENLCKICMDSVIDCVLLECGHMVTCTKCGKRMNECPICRQYVIRAVHVFRI